MNKGKWHYLLLIFCMCMMATLWGENRVQQYTLYETPWTTPNKNIQPIQYNNPYSDITVETFYMHDDPLLRNEIAAGPGPMGPNGQPHPQGGQHAQKNDNKDEKDEDHIDQEAHKHPPLRDIPHGKYAHDHQGNHLPGEHFYRLKVGDQLFISVYGEPIRVIRPIMVDPDGNISFQFINSLKVEGKTISHVRKMLEKRLKVYYKNPVVIITLSLTLGDFYTILGEVRAPGKKRILGNARILTALAQSGGFNYRDFRAQTIDTVDFNKSFLARRGELVPIDFNALVNGGDFSQNILIRPGDYIHIASNTVERVYVLGEVGQPTTVDFINTITLAEALAQAGGLNVVASSRVAIIRGALCYPKYILVDINRILKGHAIDFWLEPGDIVYVPPMRFTTIKEIAKAAIINFVGSVANIAGTRAFISVTPDAFTPGDNLGPVPTVNFGTSTTSATSTSSTSNATSSFSGNTGF